MSLKMNELLVIVVLIWAGACISGNLIAAPAKFQVAELSRAVALQVGRIQFLWVGYFEYLLAGLAFVMSFYAPRKFQILICVPILLLFLQRSVLMPQLSLRTDMIVVGYSVAHSNVHIYFILMEILKVLGLLCSGIWAVFNSTQIRVSDM